MKQTKQNPLASKAVRQTLGQVRVDQVSCGQQSRNLANIRVAISEELVAESNSYGIAATNRHEAGEQSVGLQYAIATRRRASFRTLLQTGSPQIMLRHFTKRENGISETPQLLRPRQNGNIKLGVGKHRSQ